MKNNLFKVSQLVLILSFVLLGCNPTDKNSSEKKQDEKKQAEKVQSEKVQNKFKLNSVQDTTKFETKYNDGRMTAVRNLKYYNLLVESSIPMIDDALKLTTVITEWNEYDANVASPQGAFIQVPKSFPEPDRSELIKSGVDENSLNSQMVGGDVETNRRIKEPSIRYWAVASKMFAQEFAKLKKAEGISNRDIDYVTFDFITSNGFYTVQVKKSELESGQLIWSNLFKESKFLNTEMARVQNESRKDAEKRYEDSQLKKLKNKR